MEIMSKQTLSRAKVMWAKQQSEIFMPVWWIARELGVCEKTVYRSLERTLGYKIRRVRKDKRDQEL